MSQDPTIPSWAKGAVAIIVALGGLAITLAAAGVIGDDEVRTVQVPAAVVSPTTVGVDGPDANAEPDRALALDRGARATFQRAAVAPASLDLGGDLRGSDKTPVAEHEGPLATPNFPGCSTRILPTNWSNRISTVKAVGLHYTAGGNLPGLSDMNGLTGYASSASAGVSWHFLIDAEGHCYYSVPLGKKAWTIGNLNSETVNIEVVGRGNEPSYPASAAGAAKLREVVRRIAAIYSIPLQLGAVSNCTVTRPGIITHWQGGACAGNHGDIRPYEIADVVRAIAATPCGAVCKQRKVVATRRERHATLHAEFHSECAKQMHGRRATRKECRAIKAKGRAQHRGIRRAKAKLASL